MKLEVKELRKSFGGKEILHGISFAVESGKALGLLGRNGAGKTTTIRILMDVFRPDSGQILAEGKPFAAEGLQDRVSSRGERALSPEKSAGPAGLSGKSERHGDKGSQRERKKNGWNGWAFLNTRTKNWRHCPREISRRCSWPRR